MNVDDRRPLYHFWTPNHWPLWLGLGFLRVVCWLPHRTRLGVGFALGRLAHRVTPKRRAITRRNIQLAFPDLPADERNAMAKAHFEAVGASIIEMGLARWASDEDLLPLMTIDGVHHVENELQAGKGVILLSAHFSTLEISGRILQRHVPPFDIVYRKFRNPFMTEIVRSTRERMSRKTIDKNDIKAMIRSLKEGVCVWYAPDQSYKGKQSAVMPFFGVDAMTNTATTTLGKLGRASAVPYFPRRLPDGRYHISILPPLPDFPGDAETDTANYVAVLEQHIRQCPEQYYWVHRKYKNRPPPLDNVYSDLDALK